MSKSIEQMAAGIAAVDAITSQHRLEISAFIDRQIELLRRTPGVRLGVASAAAVRLAMVKVAAAAILVERKRPALYVHREESPALSD